MHRDLYWMKPPFAWSRATHAHIQVFQSFTGVWLDCSKFSNYRRSLGYTEVNQGLWGSGSGTPGQELGKVDWFKCLNSILSMHFNAPFTFFSSSFVHQSTYPIEKNFTIIEIPRSFGQKLKKKKNRDVTTTAGRSDFQIKIKNHLFAYQNKYLQQSSRLQFFFFYRLSQLVHKQRDSKKRKQLDSCSCSFLKIN